MTEFQLIAFFFAEQNKIQRPDVILGIGDDCAILEVPKGQQLLLSMDTLVHGVHFPESTAAYDIGYKALAVNLSDLAAMGAKPAWFTLSLTMPMVDELWLADFSRGLFDLAQQFNVQLIGGDTSRGPLSITIQAHGLSPKNKVLLRQGAQPGDFIYVTQTLGDAGLALLHCLEKIQLPQAVFSKVALRLNRPFPRVREGLLFRDQAHSMIDVSDGLASDLGHILHRSGVGAIIHAERLPLSDELTQSLTPLDAVNLALTAGDDYELCCTVAENKQDAFDALLQKEACIAHCIGQVTAGNTLRILYDGLPVSQDFLQGYSHF